MNAVVALAAEISAKEKTNLLRKSSDFIFIMMSARANFVQN
jgi:hypothetical protein